MFLWFIQTAGFVPLPSTNFRYWLWWKLQLQSAIFANWMLTLNKPMGYPEILKRKFQNKLLLHQVFVSLRTFQSFQFQWFSFIVFMFSISLIFAFLLFLSSAYHGFNLQFDYDVTLIIIWFSLVYSLKICWSVSLCIAIFYGVWDSNLCLTEHLFPTLSKSPELDLDFSL